MVNIEILNIKLPEQINYSETYLYSEKNGIEFNEALFADDSRSNIKSAKDVCNTLYLPKQLGLDGTDCAFVEALASLSNVSIQGDN